MPEAGGNEHRVQSRRIGAGTLAAAASLALVLAVLSASAQLLLIAGSLLPVPLALATLMRGAVRGVALGSVAIIATGLAAWQSGASVPGLAAWAVAMVGIAVFVPLALVDTLGDGRWARHPQVTAAGSWLLVLAVVAATVILLFGRASTRQTVHDGVRQMYDMQLRECRRSPVILARSETCSRIEEQRDAALRLIRRDGALILSITIAVLSLVQGATSLWLLRLLATRRGIAARRSRGLREFEADWPVAYLLAFGLLAVMGGSRSESSIGRIVHDFGVGIVVLAAIVLIVDGLAVIAWLLHRVRARTSARVVFWTMGVIAWWLMLPMAMAIGIWDIVAHPRRRMSDIDTMDRRTTPP